MIAELIQACTADAIHLRMLKEILCENQDPKVKADHVWGKFNPHPLFKQNC